MIDWTYKNSRMEYVIDEYVHVKRNRSLLKDKLLDGETIDALAGKYFVSVQRVKTILRDFEDIAREYYPNTAE